ALVVVAAAAAVAARVAAPGEARPSVHSQALACGVERWGVKTLQDRPYLLGVRRSTVAHLNTVPRPGVLPQSPLTFVRLLLPVRPAVAARARRGRPPHPRRAAARSPLADRGGADRAGLHVRRARSAAAADAGGTPSRSPVRACRGDRRRLLRLLPRPDRGREE